MNTIVISEENHILHIINYGLYAEFTLYNINGEYLHSGIMESVYENYELKDLVKLIIELIQEFVAFTEPYIFLYGSNAIPLLSLIKYENNKQNHLKKYISSLTKKGDTFYFQERMEDDF